MIERDPRLEPKAIEVGFCQPHIELFDPARQVEPGVETGLLRDRFVVVKDIATAETYRFAQHQLAQMMAEDPAIVGAAAFGSTTKGYARPGASDMDLTVFLDADELGLGLPEEFSCREVSWNNWAVFEASDTVVDRYSRAISQALAASDHDAGMYPISADIMPIGHPFLRQLARHEIENAQAEADYAELLSQGQGTDIDRLADWSKLSFNIEELEANSDLARSVRKYNNSRHVDAISVENFLRGMMRQERSQLAGLRRQVFADNHLMSSVPPRLFSLAITPGLNEYRWTFLSELRASPAPEQAWQFFVRRMKKFDDYGRTQRDVAQVNYPDTIEEALYLYR